MERAVISDHLDLRGSVGRLDRQEGKAFRVNKVPKVKLVRLDLGAQKVTKAIKAIRACPDVMEHGAI
jgi:hypothetical protein